MQDNEKKPALRFKGFTDPWEQRKFSELYEKVSRKNDLTYGKDDIISVANMYYKAESYITDENYLLTYNVFEMGDIAFEGNKSKNFAHGRFVENTIGNGIVSHVFDVFKPRMTNYDLQFWKYAINNERIMGPILLRSTKASTMMTNLVADDFLQENFLIPCYEEQKKIGEFLNQLDTLITLHQRKYEKLVNIKKSMLDKMFPKNGASVPEIRFKGFTDPWEQRKLSELTSMHARIGWQNLRTSEFLDSGDYMLITGTDFDDGTVNYSTCHFVERERYEQDKNIQIRNGSILITKDGTLGKVAYVQGLSMPATLNAGVFNVEIRNTSIVDERYLFQYLKAPFLMDYVDKKATGGTIKHLNQNILVDFPVVMPKKTEQVSIGNFFQRIDTLITLHQRKLEKLQNIKKSCLEKMFV